MCYHPPSTQIDMTACSHQKRTIMTLLNRMCSHFIMYLYNTEVKPGAQRSQMTSPRIIAGGRLAALFAQNSQLWRTATSQESH